MYDKRPIVQTHTSAINNLLSTSYEFFLPNHRRSNSESLSSHFTYITFPNDKAKRRTRNRNANRKERKERKEKIRIEMIVYWRPDAPRATCVLLFVIKFVHVHACAGVWLFQLSCAASVCTENMCVYAHIIDSNRIDDGNGNGDNDGFIFIFAFVDLAFVGRASIDDSPSNNWQMRRTPRVVYRIQNGIFKSKFQH